MKFLIIKKKIERGKERKKNKMNNSEPPTIQMIPVFSYMKTLAIS